MNMRFTPKQKLIVAGAVSALVLGLAWWGFWRLAVGVWQRDFVLGELQSKIEAMREDRERARDLAVILERRKSDLDRIDKFFVNRERPVAFIEAIERLGAATGNKIAIDVAEARDDGQRLGFRLTLEGGENNLLRYVRLLETLPYKLEMEETFFQRNMPDSSGVPKTAAVRLILSFKVRAR